MVNKQKVIIVTAILDNMARPWGKENIEGDNDGADDGYENGDVVKDNALDTARLRGQLVMNNMLRNLPP